MKIIAIACALLHIILGLALLTPAPYHGGDNATYLALAQSLIEHGRYLELWDPAQRTATLYPPLFPVLLAAALAIGLRTWLELKLVTLGISAIAVAVSVLWLGRVSGRRAAIAGGLILAMSPGILQQSSYVLSEGLFWAFTMIALWAASHIAAEQVHDSHRMRWLIITALAAAAAALTRSAGLPLIVAIALVLLFARRWRDLAMFCAITVTPLLAWSVRARLVGARGYGSYLTMRDPYQPELGSVDVPDLGSRIITNTTTYVTELVPTLIWGDLTMRWLMAALVGVALAWWVVRLVRNPGVADIWMLLYGGLLVLWPETWAGERFALAAIPVLIWFIADLIGRLRARHRGAATFAAVATVLFAVGTMPPVLIERISAARSCSSFGDEFTCMPTGYGDFMRVADASGDALPAGSVVISRKPTLFFAQSGLRSLMYPLSADTARFFAAADSAGARYVVLDDLSQLAAFYLNPVVIAASARFCVEKALSREQAVLLQILPAARAAASGVNEDGLLPMPPCNPRE